MRAENENIMRGSKIQTKTLLLLALLFCVFHYLGSFKYMVIQHKSFEYIFSRKMLSVMRFPIIIFLAILAPEIHEIFSLISESTALKTENAEKYVNSLLGVTSARIVPQEVREGAQVPQLQSPAFTSNVPVIREEIDASETTAIKFGKPVFCFCCQSSKQS